VSDLTRYFRIEARELIDELTRCLSELARGGPAAGPAGTAARHAHTLKGAARVVGRVDLADRVHTLEELLGPFRTGTGPVATEQLEQMQALVDGLSAAVEGPQEQVGESAADAAAVVPVPRAASVPVMTATDTTTDTDTTTTAAQVHPIRTTANRSTHRSAHEQDEREHASADLPAPVRTTRASLAEIDDLIDGVSRTRSQLRPIREIARRTRQIPVVSEPANRQDRPQDRALDDLAALARTLENSTDRIERELREVYTTAERLRLIPVESIVPDLDRALRDAAATLHRRARLEVVGAQICLDATVLDAVQTALRQIVRNAVAHGVEDPQQRLAAGKPETGLVRLEITHTARGMRFSCCDDGRGIDLDRVRQKLLAAGHTAAAVADPARALALLPGSGISTAATVSEIAGHGIGLDVVQDMIGRIGGRIELATTTGAGTRIDLVTPGSMTAQEVVLVHTGPRPTRPAAPEPPVGSGILLALPLRAVRQARRVVAEDFCADGRVRHEGRAIPFAALGELVGAPAVPAPTRNGGRTVLLLDGSDGPVAIAVTRLVGTSEIAVRPLPALAPVPALVCGIWIDIDGFPRPVLDPVQIAAVAAAGQRRTERPAPLRTSVEAPVRTAQNTVPARVLLVDDSLTTRMLERSILQAAGYQVDEAGSAEEGLAMATRTAYAVAVVDVEMPGMDGFGFIEQTRLRPELRRMPCLLVTSKASAADRERGRAAGARGHIDKSDFHQRTLLETVARLLAAPDPQEPL